MAVRVVRGHSPDGIRQRALPQPQRGPYRDTHCMPLPTTPHGSAHFLRGPRGGPLMVFFWDAQFHQWVTPRRRTFPYEYLESHGWSYAGPFVVP